MIGKLLAYAFVGTGALMLVVGTFWGLILSVRILSEVGGFWLALVGFFPVSFLTCVCAALLNRCVARLDGILGHVRRLGGCGRSFGNRSVDVGEGEFLNAALREVVWVISAPV